MALQGLDMLLWPQVKAFKQTGGTLVAAPSRAWAAPAHRQSLQAALVCHSWYFVPISNCLHDWAQVVLHLDLGVKLLCHA